MENEKVLCPICMSENSLFVEEQIYYPVRRIFKNNNNLIVDVRLDHGDSDWCRVKCDTCGSEIDADVDWL